MDDAARRRLIDEHLPMVRAIAATVRKQVSERLEVDELVGYGAEGLVEAAQRFDPAHGVKFSTFAWHRVRGAIYDGMREMGQLRRAEYARLQMAARAASVTENLAEREHGAAQSGAAATAAPPSIEADLGAMADALSSVAASYVASFETLLERGEEFIDESNVDVETAMDAQTVDRRVRAVLGKLPEKERHFIEKHYFEGKTLLDAGKELGLSKSWASRLHARAIGLLRDELEKAA